MITDDINFWNFIKEYENADVAELMLQFGGMDHKNQNQAFGFNVKDAVQQIECRRKTRYKLNSFLRHPQFYFPTALAAEQASDERVAAYHASLIGTGKKVVDMTAGLGIDAMTIALAGNETTAIELEPPKCEALEHNSKIFGISGFNVVNADCIDYMKGKYGDFDCIFIDPARRDKSQHRTYFFKDCLPDVTGIYSNVMEAGKVMYIKASPILDLNAIIQELDNVARLHVVSVDHECKEILVELRPDSTFNEICVVGISRDGKIESPTIDSGYLGKNDAKYATDNDLKAGNYLYEPSAEIMKLRSASYLTDKFPRLKQACVNTWVFLSDRYYPDFPGRKLRITDIPTKKTIKKLRGERRCVVTRNYPTGSSQLMSKLELKEGESQFIYGIRFGAKSKPTIIDCEKL